MKNEIRSVEITTIGELLEAVTPHLPDPESGRLRERAVYRGVSSEAYSLITSLDRLGLPAVPPHSKAHLEEHLLRHFIRHSRPYISMRPVNEWELLVVAQHHGLPTRLMDWSYSPLTAAHFATMGGRPGTDRIVWKLDWGRMHERFGIAPVALMVEDLNRVLSEKGVTSIWTLFSETPHLKEHFVCLVEPPALDSRIVAQSAAFTLSTDKRRGLDQILIEAGVADCLTRCVIPAAYVGRLRDQLDLCSVDERRLFPDLDGVAAEIRRYYSATGEDGLEHSGQDPAQRLDAA